MNILIDNQIINTVIKRPSGTQLPTKAFIKLEAWKKCIEIKSIFNVEIIPFLPQDKQNGLGNAIRKAAISITTDYLPYNRIVSKQYNKFNERENILFVKKVRSSLSQLKNYLSICSDYNYINTTTYNKGTLLIEHTKTLLNRYIYFLSR